MKQRKLATHYIIECDAVLLWVEKIRPLLRAIYPDATESQVAKMASWVYRAGEDGHTFHYVGSDLKVKRVRIVRRECHGIYRDIAELVLGSGKNNPFRDDLDAWSKSFEGRQCHGGMN